MFRPTAGQPTGRGLTPASRAAVACAARRAARCLVLLLALVPVVRAQGTNTDGITPPGLAPGSPAGSYSLSGFETVNLYNGGLDFALPLLKVGGRGSAGYTMTLTVEQKWRVELMGETPPGQPPRYKPLGEWWVEHEPGYGPGVLVGRRAQFEDSRHYEQYPCDGVNPNCGNILSDISLRTLTRLTFVAPDGTEYELRDTQTDGSPHPTTWLPQTGDGYDFSRGRVFATVGGDATFVSDAAVLDYRAGSRIPESIEEFYDLDGYLLMSDGTRYRIEDGEVEWIRDRNGNTVSFGRTTDSAGHLVHTVTDSLGRQVRVTYARDGGTAYDLIAFDGFGGAAREIKVWRDSLHNLLRTTRTGDGAGVLTLGELFPNLSGAPSEPQPFDPGDKVSRIELPNGAAYELRYNVYGELAQVELPTGGAIEYDWLDASQGATEHVYRRVSERRVYADGAALEGRTIYGDPVTGPAVEVKGYDAGGALLAYSKHYFHSNALLLMAPRPDAAIGYAPWLSGREYRTESYDVVSGSPVLKRVVDNTWRQPVAGATWPFDGQGETSAAARPNNPRVTQTQTTLADTNQVARQDFSYDRYGNLTDTYEYDFVSAGSGAAGTLLRRTRTDFLTTNPVNGIDYTGLNPTAAAPHMRGLPERQSVYDAGGVERSRTTFEYDNYVTDAGPGGRHAGLVAYGDIFGLCTTFDSSGGCSNSAPDSYTTRGNMTGTTHYLLADDGSVAGSVTSYAQYDVAGNVLKAIDALGRETLFDFGDDFGSPDGEARANIVPTELGPMRAYALPRAVTNALGHTSYTQYDFYLGRPVDVEDANGVRAVMRYDDALDRPTRGVKAFGTAGQSQTAVAYDDAGRTVTVTSDLNAYGDNVLKSEAVYDGLGRTVQARKYEGATQYVLTEQKYDALGRASESSNPYRPTLGESPVWTTARYDALGRVASVTTPDGAKVYTLYDGARTLVTDQAGRQRVSKTDALGSLKEVWEVRAADAASGTEQVTFPVPQGVPVPAVSNGYRTAYTYDALGNLRTVTQGVQTRSFAYDSLSRLTSATNPESGTVEYRYDANGNLTLKIDPRLRAGGVTLSNCPAPYTGAQVATCYQYDSLNRIKSRKYNDGTPDVTYTYDAAAVANSKGRLTSVASSVSAYSYTAFDATGRVTASSQTTGGMTYTLPEYKYDLAGNLTSEKYPSGKVVETQYDAGGRVAGVRRPGGDYYAGGDPNVTNNPNVIRYAPQGGVAALRLGNGLWERTEYNNRLQPGRIRLGTQSAAGSVLQLDYGYGTNANNGNLLSQTITVPASGAQPGLAVTQTYSYDALNRLESAREASGASEVWKQAYLYDRYGNRTLNASQTTLPKLTAPGQTASPAVANPSVQAATNRLTEDQDGDGAKEYTYDKAGNMTCDAGHCGGAAASPYYEYDAENHLTEAGGGPSAGGASYFYDGDGRRVKKEVGASVTVFVYDASGKLVAEYGGEQPQQQGGVSYFTLDDLGSTRVVTGESQEVRARYDYFPFGEEISAGRPGYAAADVRQRYTGKERDDETGLDYFLARHYSSAGGRFVSADPIFLKRERLSDPQRLNLFTYARNNPHLYVDPTGEDIHVKITNTVTDQTRIKSRTASEIKAAERENKKKGIDRPTYRNMTVNVYQVEVTNDSGGKFTFHVTRDTLHDNADGSSDSPARGNYGRNGEAPPGNYGGAWITSATTGLSLRIYNLDDKGQVKMSGPDGDRYAVQVHEGNCSEGCPLIRGDMSIQQVKELMDALQAQDRKNGKGTGIYVNIEDRNDPTDNFHVPETDSGTIIFTPASPPPARQTRRP